MEDVQGVSDLDETVPDEVLGKRSEIIDRILQISSGAVLEPQDQVLIACEFVVDHPDDVPAWWEDLLEDSWF